MVVKIWVVEEGMGGGEDGRRGGEGGKRGKRCCGVGICGCGRNAGSLFWAVVVMSVEGEMGGKTVGLGEGKRREGEGVVESGEKGEGEALLRGRFSGLWMV